MKRDTYQTNLRAFWLFACLILSALTGCDRSTQKVREYLQAATGDLQAKRATSISEASLEKLERVDLLVAIPKLDFNRIKPELANALNDSQTAKKNGLHFQQVEVTFGTQTLSVGATFNARLQEIEVDATLDATAVIAAADDGLMWNLYLNGISLDSVKSNSRLTDAAAHVVAHELAEMLPVLNVVLDEAVNSSQDRSLLLRFSKKGLIDQHLSSLSTNDVSIDDGDLTASLISDVTAVLIDERGLLVAAQIHFVPTSDFATDTPTFPAATSLLSQDSAKVAERERAYQAKALEKIAELSGRDLSKFVERKATGVALSKSAVSQLFSTIFPKGGIHGTITVDKSTSSSTELTFKITMGDCSRYFDACHYRNICTGNRCEEKISETVHRTCDYSCWIETGGLGAIGGHHGLCHRACDATRVVTKPIGSADCDAFRLADKASGDTLCKVASNVDKAVCDVGAAGQKLVCDGVNEIGRFYEKNPVATVESTLSPKAKIAASIANAQLATDLATLSATVSASGVGSLTAGIRYDRHNYADALVLGPGVSLGAGCAVDWKESVDLQIAASLPPTAVSFSITPEPVPEGGLRLVFVQQTDVLAHADFNPAPLEALFVGKPQVTLNCPLAAVGAAIFGTAEAVFTKEDARKVFPLLTGRNYPVDIAGQRFMLQIDPIAICAPSKQRCENPLLRLVPHYSSKAIVFEGTTAS